MEGLLSTGPTPSSFPVCPLKEVSSCPSNSLSVEEKKYPAALVNPCLVVGKKCLPVVFPCLSLGKSVVLYL